MGDPTREAHLGGVLRYALAAASLGAGLIHFTAIFDHGDHAVVALFFLLLAAAQLAWGAAVVVVRPAPALLKAGAALSVGVVAIWLISRTTGVPGVPGAEDREVFGLKDSVASALEVILAGGVAAQSAAWGQALRLATGRLASGLAVAAIGVLTAAGLSAPGHDQHEGGGRHHSGSQTVGEHRAGSHDHQAAGGAHSAGSTHEHAAGSDRRHDAGHLHGDPAGSLALAAGESHGDADHDHNAPGHIHDPSHHHHHSPSSSQPEGHPAGDHPAGHDSGTGHDHSAPAEEAHGHDHESGEHHEDGRGQGHDHGDGTHDEQEFCTSPLPENQAVQTLQQTAQSVAGVGCHVANTFSPNGNLRRHSTLQRSREHFIS